MINSKKDSVKSELALLIKDLVTEKERHRQERISQKIMSFKNEHTAELIAELFYSDDAYIRNMAIEMLVSLGEQALPILGVKLSDRDRNIRKFSLDALKLIKGKLSCEIALTALGDQDENVVEAVLEVISEQSYQEATGKLLNVFESTESIWIMNALIRTFEQLGVQKISEVLLVKIRSLLNATAVEKNILMNTYVRALGVIGSFGDIDSILNDYSQNYVIEKKNVLLGLCGLVLNSKAGALSDDTLCKLKKVLKECWDPRESTHILFIMEALTQLKMDFFLEDIQRIYSMNKSNEFFMESLYSILHQMAAIPSGFISEILMSDEPELVILGLKLIHSKSILGFNPLVGKLCSTPESEIGQLAVRIIAETESYRDTTLLEKLVGISEVAEIAAIESKGDMEAEEDFELLFSRIEHPNLKVRKAAAHKLLSCPRQTFCHILEEIVRRNHDEEGIEALGVLYSLNADLGWNYITQKMDSKNENVRAGLIEILDKAADSVFYEFMHTMINDPSPVVRRKAIKALTRKVDNSSFQLLVKLYEDESVRMNCVEIISNLHRFNHEGAFTLASTAAHSPDVLVRMAAIRSLQLFHDVRANKVLRSMLSDSVIEVREAAQEALYEAGVTR